MTSSTQEVVDMVERQPGVDVVTAGMAGMVASVPMGLTMIGLHKILPGKKGSSSDRHMALPPKQITAKAARKVSAEEVMPPGQTWGLVTWMAHLGYGAVVASLYPLVTRPLQLPALAKGMLFGLAVWVGSYQGWLPAARILPPATELPGRRNAVMLISHLVWGSLIGLLIKQRELGEIDDFTI